MAKHDQYHEHLKKVPMFADLDKHELDRLGQTTTDLDYEAGRVLMRQGQTAHEMFVVVDGTLDVTRDDQHIAEIGPGGFAGEMALITHGHRNSTVTAKTAARVLHIDGRAFSALLDDVPQIAVKMLPIVAGRVVENSDDHTH